MDQTKRLADCFEIESETSLITVRNIIPAEGVLIDGRFNWNSNYGLFSDRDFKSTIKQTLWGDRFFAQFSKHNTLVRACRYECLSINNNQILSQEKK